MLVLIWFILFVVAVLNAYFDWHLLAGMYVWVAIALGLAGYPLLMLRPVSVPPPGRWSVTITGDAIRTSDGRSPPRDVAVAELRRVLIATDDSGPWGDDLVYLLFADGPDPVGVFPQDAEGAGDFAGWLATRPGWNAEAFARAMGSTDVAVFEIYVAEPPAG